jgi:hypothetical protein
MTMTELMTKILAILPDAVFGQELNGEILIATGLIEGDNDDLVDLN